MGKYTGDKFLRYHDNLSFAVIFVEEKKRDKLFTKVFRITREGRKLRRIPTLKSNYMLSVRALLLVIPMKDESI